VTRTSSPTRLNSELSEAFPGVVFNFSQYISDNVEEAVSGVKGENSVKVFGPDLETNEKNADAIVDVMATFRASKDLGMFSRWGSRTSRSSPTARRARATGSTRATSTR
jgi:cobalt-zinc-cadmium resistance protein CzcA